MMLSDNYGPVGDDAIIRQARFRAEKIANCAAINEVARLGQALGSQQHSDPRNGQVLR